MHELEAVNAKLAERDAVMAALTEELQEAQELESLSRDELEMLRESEAEKIKELEMHEARLPDLAAASESYLLLQVVLRVICCPTALCNIKGCCAGQVCAIHRLRWCCRRGTKLWQNSWIPRPQRPLSRCREPRHCRIWQKLKTKQPHN